MMTPRVRTLFALLLVVTLVLTGCRTTASTTSSKESATPTPIPPPPVPDKPTYTVQMGEVIDSLSFTGRVAPMVERELFFRANGRVKQVFVERNDMVEEGTLLADLENDDLLRQLAQAEIDLEATQASFSESEAGRQLTIGKAQINHEIKQLQLSKLENTLAAQELSARIAAADLARFKAGATADEREIAQRNLEKAKNSLWSAQINRDATCGQTKGAACDSAQANVQRAEEDVRISEINLAAVQRGPSAQDIAAKEAAYQQKLTDVAQTRLDIEMKQQELALSQLELDNLLKDADPALTKNVERSKLSVERLKAQLADTQVFSPIAGKVTSVSAYAGREVQAFRPVFVVADEAELEITAEPMSSQLQRLAEGMQASIILSAYPGKELVAEITQLPYPYGRGGGATSTIETADKLTHISFDPEDLAIGPGDLVKVIVVLERKADALWLPPAAIRTFAGRKFVVVEEEGRQRRVDITIGIESAERVEVKEGLERGMIVVGQ
jgi:multidrug efflux pump subunit AcrA (membrane-fusion protein)